MKSVFWKNYIFCAFVSSALPVVATTVDIAPDGMLVINGKRTFLLGLYENLQDDDSLHAVKTAGFMLTHVQGKREELDRLEKHGMYGWVNTGSAIDLSKDRAAREIQLKNMVAELGDHPALLVWEVPDEALWNVWYACMTFAEKEKKAVLQRIRETQDESEKANLRGLLDKADSYRQEGDYQNWEKTRATLREQCGLPPLSEEVLLSTAQDRSETLAAGMLEGYHYLKKLDPNHPVWMNHAPRNSIEQLALFGKAADIVGCDIYPVPSQRTGHSDLADTSLSAVGAYTLRMRLSAPNKPVWMVLQGFGWADLDPTADVKKREEQRRPTKNESRFMAYDAIVRGARGILYWGTSQIEKNSALWNDLLDLAKELAQLQPVLSAPNSTLPLNISIDPTWGSVDRSVVILPKEVDGRVWLLVVNEWREPLWFTVSGFQTHDKKAFVDVQTGKEYQIEDGKIRLSLRGNGVKILQSK
ncbi:MAG TPA: hypothetical protein PKY35_12345 [Candidatus Hydrogenedentes bacterium]|nr:hypothetical protein [Candidatus Hydrogenedentota bacterium]HOL77808.1 hypothetical protein [Candidatus Hydrogenedentota bacterium]HPO86870.1 hypothetical protein [Candidatus Hydrogenedentota bacterium]